MSKVHAAVANLSSLDEQHRTAVLNRLQSLDTSLFSASELEALASSISTSMVTADSAIQNMKPLLVQAEQPSFGYGAKRHDEVVCSLVGNKPVRFSPSTLIVTPLKS